MNHGTYTGYKKHMSDGIPFPEDLGGLSCGCRMANRLAAYDYRTKHSIKRVLCATCGNRRAIRPGRDGQCAECWQRAEKRRLEAERMRADRESPAVLRYGRWVPNRHGVLVWQAYEGAAS